MWKIQSTSKVCLPEEFVQKELGCMYFLLMMNSILHSIPKLFLHTVKEFQYLIHFASTFFVQMFGIHPLPVLDFSLECEFESLGEEEQRSYTVCWCYVFYFLFHTLSYRRTYVSLLFLSPPLERFTYTLLVSIIIKEIEKSD